MSLVVVGSGRAGVGTTTVATLVAGAAARWGGAEPVLVDLAGNGGLAPILGRYAPTVRTLQSSAELRASSDDHKLDAATIGQGLVTDAPLRVRALLAAPGRAEQRHLMYAVNAVLAVRSELQLVVDLGTAIDGSESLFKPILRSADTVLLVTNLAAPSVHATGRAAKQLVESVGVPAETLRLVVNQAVSGTGMTPDLVAESIPDAELIGTLPLATQDVLEAVNRVALAELLDHPVLGPLYGALAQRLLPTAVRA